MKFLKITVLLLFIVNIGCAQDSQTKEELENQIIGSWHLENSPEAIWTFSEDGTVKRFNGDELISSSKYEITKNCDGENLSNKNFFLREMGENGNISCAYIEAINYDNNGFFSLMTLNQGKIVVFKKVQKKSMK
ncbi:hypothetical protein ML462_15490 [Gramella lutea]|uniref:Lipocalin-like domain-containing protein n=1 Tax=Christiangramia lutea TaxID=1607951 RepID=A0A9X2ABV6_9FLAO|nr:hypothetical protein [Christiangramia lutea]MCH4824576.1 hypothetical protein [Christiangramia lutea]